MGAGPRLGRGALRWEEMADRPGRPCDAVSTPRGLAEPGRPCGSAQRHGGIRRHFPGSGRHTCGRGMRLVAELRAPAVRHPESRGTSAYSGDVWFRASPWVAPLTVGCASCSETEVYCAASESLSLNPLVTPVQQWRVPLASPSGAGGRRGRCLAASLVDPQGGPACGVPRPREDPPHLEPDGDPALHSAA